MRKLVRWIGGLGTLAVLLVGGGWTTTAADDWWKPTPGSSWQIQLNGLPDTQFAVEVYHVDLRDTPQKTIDALHAAGRKVICYFSAGSWENWRPDAGDFPAATIGRPLDGWPGERWLDVRAKLVRAIMRDRLALAVTKRCDAVDPDNVDGYTANTGFPLTAADQLNYNRFLATEAHRRGLGVGLKNDVEQIPRLIASFDFTVNEKCFKYKECNRVVPFVDADKAVFNIEYGGAKRARKVCPEANDLGFDSLIKNLDLEAKRIACSER